MEMSGLNSQSIYNFQKKIKSFTYQAIGQFPDWIKDLIANWEQMMIRITSQPLENKKSPEEITENYKNILRTCNFYRRKIKILQNLIYPASQMEVNDWSKISKNKKKEIQIHLERTIKVLKILGPDRNSIYKKAITELSNIGKKFSLNLTPA